MEKYKALGINVSTSGRDYLNPFHANVPFLYPLKTSENPEFSDAFRGYIYGTFAWSGF